MITESKNRSGERFGLSQEQENLLRYGQKYPFLIEGLLREKMLEHKGDCGCGGAGQDARPHPDGMLRMSAIGRAISLDPKTGQGYLVLNRAGNPKVNRWLVTVSAATMRKGQLVSQREVERVELTDGLNWWRVPRKYLSAEGIYTISVQGMSSSNALVVEEGPLLVSSPRNPGVALEVGGTPWLQGCKWVCNGAGWMAGRGYAWEIVEYLHPNGYTQAYYSVQTAYAGFDEESQLAIPFYSFFKLDVFNALFVDNVHNSALHLPGEWYQDEVQITPILNSTAENQFYDDDGVGLIGPVRGIAKGLGPWADRVLITEPLHGNTTMNLGCSPSSSAQRHWAMGRINSYADFSVGLGQSMPRLACIPSKAGMPVSGGINCGVNQVIADHLNNSGGPVTSLGQIQSLVNECMGGKYPTLTLWKYEKWPKGTGFTDNNPETNWGSMPEAHAPADGLALSERELSPGLYTFGFTGGGLYLPAIVEVNRHVLIREV